LEVKELSADFTSFISHLIEVLPPGSAAWGLFAFLVFLWLIFLIPFYAPGFPGVVKGVHIVHGFYAGGKHFLRLFGNLVDCTYTWLPDYVAKAFREEVVLEGLQADLERETDPQRRREIEEVIDFVKRENFLSYVKVFGLRSRTWRKHLLICVFSSIEDREIFPAGRFSAASPKPSLNILSLEVMNKGVVEGTIYTYPKRWRVPRLGKVYVHIFRPWPIAKSDREFVEQLPQLDALAKIVVYAPFNVDVKSQLKVAKKMAEASRRKEREAHEEKALYATAMDTTMEFATSFLPKADAKAVMDKMTRMLQRRLQPYSSLSSVLTLLGVVLGGLAAQQLNFNPLFGAVAGAVAAIVFSYFTSR
jgi:hypothetical protein